MVQGHTGELGVGCREACWMRSRQAASTMSCWKAFWAACKRARSNPRVSGALLGPTGISPDTSPTRPNRTTPRHDLGCTGASRVAAG